MEKTIATHILSLSCDEVTFVAIEGKKLVELGIDAYAGENGVTLVGSASALEEWAAIYFIGKSEVPEIVEWES